MDNETPEAAPNIPTRSDAQRERYRRNQLIAAQTARSRAAGGAPGDAEAARLVADFHARGGQVTVCAPSGEEQPGTEAERGTTGKRSGS